MDSPRKSWPTPVRVVPADGCLDRLVGRVDVAFEATERGMAADAPDDGDILSRFGQVGQTGMPEGMQVAAGVVGEQLAARR